MNRIIDAIEKEQFKTDATKFKIANRAEINAKRDTKILCREKFNLKERKACREQNMSEGFDVYPSDIYWFLRWRAGSFASLGQAPADIERDLYAQVKRFCLNGKAFCDTKKGQETIHKVAYDPTLKQGDASQFYDIMLAKANHIQSDPGTQESIVVYPNIDPRRALILETIEALPDGVSSDKAYSAIERACSKAEMKFDRESPKDKMLVSRLRKKVGIRTSKEGKTHYWLRKNA